MWYLFSKTGQICHKLITTNPTRMPHSIILTLLPQSTIPPQFLTGRHFHALFLKLVSSVDPDLGECLHDTKADKAFTLSPLQVQTPNKSKSRNHILQWQHSRAIPTRTPCWWRISLLDDALFGHLGQLWQNLNPEHPWHLGPADLQITRILTQPTATQPWANGSTYTQLYEQASHSDRHLAFTISTPACFRQGHYDAALPTRESMFNSLLNRWHRYSGIEFPANMVESIFPSFFDIRTEMVADSRSKFIGCVGDISFRILGDVDPVKIKQINALADFAFYSGVGRKTPMGMGMLRRLHSEKG